MTMIRKLAAALIAASALAALAAPAARTFAEPPPGPPWPVNFPASKMRPASDAPEKDFAFAELEKSAGPIGVAVTISAAIAKPRVGNDYELNYQLRLHTKKGEYGPLLGSGKSQTVLLRHVTCKYDWIEFYEKVDVTRKELTGMTNLPSPRVGNDDVLLRVEPQLYDVAEKKYLTPPKTPAAILVARVGAAGKVWELRSLSAWLVERSASESEAKKTLARLADLDEFSFAANNLAAAINTVLTAKSVSAKTKVLYIGAVPAQTLASKTSYALRRSLENLAAGPDEDLKLASQQKLDEAK
jgi:hypothetical protein